MVTVAEKEKSSYPEDAYNVVDLEKDLTALGYHVLPFQSETPSTMLLLKNHILQSGPLPAVVLSDHQTKGEGRGERKIWYDSKGASLLLSVGFHVQEDALASFADLVALRTCQVLQQETENEVKVKYPNDLVFRGEKLGGILVSPLYDDHQKYMGTNVGIGINVHYGKRALEAYPTDYGATSLDLITNSFHNRQVILIQILESLRHLPPDATILEHNVLGARNHYDGQWRSASEVLGQIIIIENSNGTIVKGVVQDTQIGRGILVRQRGIQQWFNYFDQDMKLRIVQ